MPSYSKNDVVLVRYPYTDLTSAKVRPAAVVGAPSMSDDVVIVPLTSRLSPLDASEFALADWSAAGLNRPTAVKRGLFTLHESLVTATLGTLSAADAANLEASLRVWLDLR